MRVLVTGGAGFIGSHFVKRLVAAGDEVVVLDKLTYAGNPANLEGTGVELVVGDIADPDAVARAATGCDAIVNFAAETHVDRSILGPKEFVHTDVLGTMTLLEWARSTAARYVQVSTDEVYGDLEGAAARARTIRSTRRARTARRRRAATCRCSRTSAPTASTRRSRAARTRSGRTSTRRSSCRCSSRTRSTASRCPSTATASRSASGSTPRTTARESSSSFARASPARSTTSAARITRTSRSRNRILELTGADPALIRHVEDRAGHDRRYAIDDAKLRSLGWAPRHSFGEGGLRETVDWYRDNRAWWEPIKSGEYRRYYEEQYAERLGA